MKHSLSWVLWLIMTMAILLATRHPLYLLIILIGLFFLGSALAKKVDKPSWGIQNMRFLVTMVLLSAIINTLFTHVGESILFKLPQNWALIGGIITLESLVFGLINGLVIGSLYITFNIINLALSIRQITRLIPNFFHPIATTITIALTFFPSIQQRALEIKEAQMIRGNPMKRISDWLPLLLPLLVTSLENAFQLSESMTARGYHTQRSTLPREIPLIGILIAVFSIFSGWVLRLYDYPETISLLLTIFGGLVLFFTIILADRYTKMTRFHQESWGSNEMISTILFSLMLLSWIILRLTDRLPSLTYSPYPSLSMPPVAFTGILLSIVPVIPLIFLEHD